MQTSGNKKEYQIGFITALIVSSLVSFQDAARANSPTPPEIEWDYTVGGIGDDNGWGLELLPDGGYLLSGMTLSPPSGLKTSEKFWEWDGWIVRLDKDRNVLWEKTLGAFEDDRFFSSVMTEDGGIIAAGITYSSEGLGTRESQLNGDKDAWLVRMNQNGEIVWEKTWGGSNADHINMVNTTHDGNFVALGWSESSETNLRSHEHFGGRDYWLIKFSPDGEVIWNKTYGGTASDMGDRIIPTSDGGFLLNGFSRSATANPSNKSSDAIGDGDCWIIKITGNGQIEWDRTFGSESFDGFPRLSLETPDGGFLIGMRSEPGTHNDVKTLHGFADRDAWLIRLDPEGNKLWEYVWGGYGSDRPYEAVNDPNGGFIVSAFSDSSPEAPLRTASPPSRTSETYGGSDIVLFHLDDQGNKSWETSAGGNAFDFVIRMKKTMDGGHILLGGSDSISETGTKTAAHYENNDMYLVKFAALAAPTDPDMLSFEDSFDGIPAPGWDLVDFAALVGGESDFRVENDAYTIEVPPSPMPESVPPLAGAFLPDWKVENGTVSIDFTGWDSSEERKPLFTLAHRTTQNPDGKRNYYGLMFQPDPWEAGPPEFRGEPALFIQTFINDEPVSLDAFQEVNPELFHPNKTYRLVFTAEGSQLSGAIYDVQNLSSPLAEVSTTNNRLKGGHTGFWTMERQWLKGLGNEPSQITVDNFSLKGKEAAPPPELSLRSTITLEWPNHWQDWEVMASSELEGDYTPVDEEAVLHSSAGPEGIWVTIVPSETAQFFQLKQVEP